METALREITLVLFTTIAPAGIVGYITMTFFALFSDDKQQSTLISHYLIVPLVLTITGLIASATHLGTPANALYVLTGIGRSPLSNEVVAVVAFLALGGTYWIVSFRDTMKRNSHIIWLALTLISGLVAIGFIALAYSVASVPTWSLPTAPITLWLSAFSSGPLVGIFSLLLAHTKPDRKISFVALSVAGCAALANVIVLFIEWNLLAGIVSTLTRAVDLVPVFPLVIALYGILEIIALASCIYAVVRSATKVSDPFDVKANKCGHMVCLVLTGIGSLLALLGCFGIRFIFYAMHMTLGI